MGKFFERKSSQWQESVWEEISKTVQRLHQWRVHETCDFWRPPECQHYKTQSGCKFGEKCVFRDKVDSQPNKKQKKNGGKGSVALWKNSKQFVCVFQDVEPSKSKIYEGHQILGTEAKRASPKSNITPRENSGKKGSFARCDSEHWY